MIEWISEGEELPRIGQHVLVLLPRQTGGFWDISVRRLLARHEGVIPHPVVAGSRWPTDYYWGNVRSREDTSLITGNGWWAHMDGLPLPPGAKHREENGYKNIYQLGEVFIPQAR